MKRGTKSDAETETDAEPTQVPVEDVETGDSEFGSTDLSLTPTPELTPASDDPAALAEQEQEQRRMLCHLPAENLSYRLLCDYFCGELCGSAFICEGYPG